MRRRVGLFVFAALFVAAVACLSWMFLTPGGTGAVIRLLSYATGTVIETGEIAGGLARGLTVANIAVTWPRGRITVEHLEVAWQPWRILSGRLAVRRAVLSGVVYDDAHDIDPGSPLFEWPGTGAISSWLRAEIGYGEIDRFTYLRKGETALHLDRMAGRFSWYYGHLRGKELRAEFPRFLLAGSMEGDLPGRLMKVRFDLHPRRPVPGTTRVAIKGEFSGPGDPRRVSGRLHCRAADGHLKDSEVNAELQVEGRRIELGTLRLTQPGRRGAVTGAVSVDLAGPQPSVSVRLAARDLDLSREISFLPSLSGTMEGTTDLSTFDGRFHATGKGRGWENMGLEGRFRFGEDFAGVEVRKGTILGGRVSGRVEAGWATDTTVKGEILLSGMNPSLINREWRGVINARVKGSLILPPEGPPTGRVRAEAFRSTLWDRAFSGRLEAEGEKTRTRIGEFTLEGHDLEIRAKGTIQERVEFRAKIGDLARLIPDSKGRIHAEGWGRWRQGALAGVLTARAWNCRYRTLSLREALVKASLDTGTGGGLIDGEATIRDGAFGALGPAAGRLRIAGSLTDHTMEMTLASRSHRLSLRAGGSYSQQAWKGRIKDLSGQDEGFGPWALEREVPLSISRERLVLEAFALSGARGERIEGEARISLQPFSGAASLRVQDMEAARFGALLPGAGLAGRVNASLSMVEGLRRTPVLSGVASMKGTVTSRSVTLDPLSVEIQFRWTEGGLSAGGTVSLPVNGSVGAALYSSDPPSRGVPERVVFDTKWNDVDLTLLKALVPKQVDLTGKVSGGAKGAVVNGRTVLLDGSATLTHGVMGWQTDEGRVDASFKKGHVEVSWSDRGLRGRGEVGLTDIGVILLDFGIPLPPRFPLSMDPKGAVEVNVRARMKERGLLAALLPGIVADTRGEALLSAGVRGTWEAPVLEGSAEIQGGGGYLPQAGIRLTDIGARVALSGDRITVTSMAVKSGKGQITGTSTATIGDGRITGFEGRLSGQRFLAVDLPEVKAEVNPDLQFRQTGGVLQVRGDVEVPYLSLRGAEKKGPVPVSRDVVVEGRPGPKQRSLPFKPDLRVRVALGMDTSVRAEGLTARLAGGLLVIAEKPDEVRGQGEIRLVDGGYSAYGTKLQITRGRIIFVGEAIDRPNLDILAVRTIETGDFLSRTVTAGVLVTGTPAAPLIRLYSEPSMSDSDILATIVLGRPITTAEDTQQLALRAAGGILLGGRSSGFQDRIREGLGLDVLDIESTGRDLSGSLLKVGKFLSPRLYIGIGQSLLSREYRVNIKYSLGRRWEIETSTGTETGADLYYRIHFD